MGSIFDQTSILTWKWNLENIIMQKMGGGESKGGRVCGERLFLICTWVQVPGYFNFSIKQQSTVKGGSQCSASCARIDVQLGFVERGGGWVAGGVEASCG